MRSSTTMPLGNVVRAILRFVGERLTGIPEDVPPGHPLLPHIVWPFLCWRRAGCWKLLLRPSGAGAMRPVAGLVLSWCWRGRVEAVGPVGRELGGRRAADELGGNELRQVRAEGHAAVRHRHVEAAGPGSQPTMDWPSAGIGRTQTR